MKKKSTKIQFKIILFSLLFGALLSGLFIPSYGIPAQTASSPTPTIQTTVNGQIIQSGDTEGLILGAGIILFIILGGVILQRTVLKDAVQKSGE